MTNFDKRKTTLDQEANIIKKYLQGYSLTKLSKEYNLTKSVMRRVLRENNICRRTLKESCQKYKNLETRIIQMYNQGKSLNTVGDIFNIAACTVRNILLRNNIFIRNQKKYKILSKRIFSEEQEKIIIEKYIKNFISCNKLSQEYKCSNSVIRGILIRNDIVIRTGRDNLKRFNINEFLFENPQFIDKYFMLGVLFADGCIIIKDNIYLTHLQLQEQDKCLIEYFSQQFNSNHPLKYCKKRKTWGFWVANKKIAMDLDILGCTPNKTYTLKFPNWCKDEWFNHFLHGLVVGDGCIAYYPKSNSYTFNLVGTKDLIETCSKKIKEILNINARVAKCSSTDKVIQLNIGGIWNFIKICNFIFKDCPFLLPRKFKVFSNIVFTNYDRLIKTTKDINNLMALEEALKICKTNLEKFKKIL